MAEILTLSGATFTRERKAPAGRLDSDPVAIAIKERMVPVTDTLFQITAQARKLVALCGGDFSEAARHIAAELETVGIRMEVRS